MIFGTHTERERETLSGVAVVTVFMVRIPVRRSSVTLWSVWR